MSVGVYIVAGLLIVFGVSVGRVVEVRKRRNLLRELGELRGLPLSRIEAAIGAPSAVERLPEDRALYTWRMPGHTLTLAFTGRLCDGLHRETIGS